MITLETIYNFTHSTDIRVLIILYFLLYISVTNIQSILNLEVSFLNLTISRKILSGLLITYLALLINDLLNVFCSNETTLKFIVLGTLISLLILFKWILFYIVSVLAIRLTALIKGFQSYRGIKRVSDERKFVVDFNKIKNISKDSGLRILATDYFKFHIINIFVVSSLIFYAFTIDTTSGLVSIVMSILFFSVGIKERAAPWKRGELADHHHGSFIKYDN